MQLGTKIQNCKLQMSSSILNFVKLTYHTGGSNFYELLVIVLLVRVVIQVVIKLNYLYHVRTDVSCSPRVGKKATMVRFSSRLLMHLL